MISFLLCLALLIVGYFVYGKIVDNTFGPDDRETPAVRINDGVDYVVMPQWKLFLVQLLNIAGLGPIFGALQGALWGPVVFLWITFGTIFAGGVHDYFSGMMSERNDGASIAEVTGRYLGPVMQTIMRVFSVVLLIMVGTVFAVGPAGLIVTLCKNGGMSGVMTTTLFWLIIILVYYFIATFISIDAIIGKIYPLFGICLGMQIAVIEFARNAAGIQNANSGEFDELCKDKVIDFMPGQSENIDKGGTLRLGEYPCVIAPGTTMERCYGTSRISERHRHRYEVNNDFREDIVARGLLPVGLSPDGRLVEMVENPTCRWFVAAQFQPEFKSRPNKPHPLFNGFVKAALE